MPEPSQNVTKSARGYPCDDHQTSIDRTCKDVLQRLTFQLTDLADIKHLCEVSKSLCLLSLPYLYESLVLESSHGEYGLEEIDVEPLRLARDRGRLSYTRDIKITSKFHDIVTMRCMHHRAYHYDLLDEDEEDGKITSNLMPLLEAFEYGKLRSLE